MMRLARTRATALLMVVACSPNLAVEGEPAIVCDDDRDCPAGLECNQFSRFCGDDRLTPPALALSATPGQADILLTWIAPLTNYEAVVIERERVGEGLPTVLVDEATPSGATGLFADSSVEFETTYVYRARLRVAGEMLAPNASDELNVLSSAAPPTNLSAVSFSSTGTTITWSDSNATTSSYRVQRRGTGDGEFSTIAEETTDTAFDDQSLSAETGYFYRVATRNPAGLSLPAEVSVVTLSVPPSGLVATTVSSAAIELAWVDNAASDSGVLVERRQGVEPFQAIVTLAANTTTYSDSMLAPGATYDYRVRSLGPWGQSEAAEVRERTSNDPVLSWTEAPTVSETCDLSISGAVVVDTDKGASISATTGAIAAATNVSADADGVYGELFAFDSEPFDASWTVDDDLGGHAVLNRSLVLSQDSIVTLPAVTQEIALHGVEGLQHWNVADEAGLIAMPGPCTRCLGTRGQISGGGGVTAILGPNGEVRAFGSNSSFAVGNALAGSRRAAVRVCAPETPEGGGCLGQYLSDVIAVAAGDAHACAVQSTGDLLCWGEGANGRLGTGDDLVRASPVPVCTSGISSGCSSFLENVVAVDAANDFTCAITSDTRAKCWGSGTGGRLGNGIVGVDQMNPVDLCNNGSSGPTGDDCNGGDYLTGVVGIAIGGAATSAHGCVLLGDGRVKCWGRNGAQLGCGDPCTSTGRPIPAFVCGVDDDPSSCASQLSGVRMIAVGTSHSCALLDSTEVVCWGSHHDGKLGNGQTVASNVPTPVCTSLGCSLGDRTLTGVVSLSAGASHTCAVLDTGQLACWGNNNHAQVGLGETGDQPFPITVCASGSGTDCPKLTDVVGVTASSSRTCALMRLGGVKCWGRGPSGNGAGSTTTINATPVDVCQSNDDFGDSCEAPLENANRLCYTWTVQDVP